MPHYSFSQLITPLKPFHPTGSIDDTTLPGKEGMTLTAYLNLQYLLGRPGSEGITTSTDYLGVFIILRVNLVRHTTGQRKR